MRTVSFFGPKEGGIEGGRTEADNGRVAAGGFGDGKKLVDEISSGADCGEDGTGGPPVSRTGNWIRTVSRGFTLGAGGPAAALQADAAARCEPSLFLVGQVRPLLLEKLIKNRRLVTTQSCSVGKCDSRQASRS